MRCSRFLLSVAVFLTLLPAVASAASTANTPPARTVETLLSACTSEDKTYLMRCNAYLAGVADSMDFMAGYLRVHGPALKKSKVSLRNYAICHAQPWTPEALRQSFINWANANPDRQQEDQYFAVVDAFHQSMPCK